MDKYYEEKTYQIKVLEDEKIYPAINVYKTADIVAKPNFEYALRVAIPLANNEMLYIQIDPDYEDEPLARITKIKVKNDEYQE